MKSLFTDKELADLGFEAMGRTEIDFGYYEWWKLSIGGLDLCFTNEIYEDEDIDNVSLFEIGEKTIYTDKITNEEILILINILKK